MSSVETGSTPPWEEMYTNYENSQKDEATSPKPENVSEITSVETTEVGQELSLGQKAKNFLYEMDRKMENKVVNFLADKYLSKDSNEAPSKVLKRAIRWNAVRSGVFAGCAAVALHHGVDSSVALGVVGVNVLAFESRQLYKAHQRYKEKRQ